MVIVTASIAVVLYQLGLSSRVMDMERMVKVESDAQRLERGMPLIDSIMNTQTLEQ